MNIKRPLKHPYLVLLFISVVCLVLGYAGVVLPNPEPKSMDVDTWICIVGFTMIVTGIITFVLVLLWMISVGIYSGLHTQNRDR